jgi:hypothetical protein
VSSLPASPLFDPHQRDRLPAPIARRARTLAHEHETNGEETTPDELAHLIEATLDHLFRLWVMEYANVDAPDATANRALFGTLSERPTLGLKVGLAQQLRSVFLDRGLTTVVEGLTTVDFGDGTDAHHPIARLITFRNAFAHGSFTAAASAIREHRALIEQILVSIPGLWKQPVMVVTESSDLLALRGEVERLTIMPVTPAAALHPFVAAADGRGRLDLFPMWQVGRVDGEWTLVAPDGKATAQNVETFFARESLRQYAERWQREREGFLDHRAAVTARAWRPLAAAELAELRSAIAAEQLVLVEARPGCGKAAAMAALLDGQAIDAGRFADVSCIVIERGEPSHSAATFAGFVARAVERALGQPPRWSALRKGSNASPLSAASLAAAQLAKSGKQVLIGVEDAHLGTVPQGPGEPSVASVVRALAGSNVHFVMTAHSGAMASPLAYDRRVELAIPPEPRVDRIAMWLRGAIGDRPLHRRVLAHLVAQGSPQTLFEICDALDEGQEQPVFEPAVERALADLRPVLVAIRTQAGADRIYHIAHAAIAAAFSAEGGAS